MTRVLPGNRVEVTAPELIEGEDVEVIEVDASKPNIAKGLSSKSEEEASEDELG